MAKFKIGQSTNPRNIITTLPDNYVYFHHTNEYIYIPVDPETISDSMGASFADNFPIARSAPIYSYQHSGPRTIRVQFKLHRDLMTQMNMGNDSVTLGGDNDYVDQLIKRCHEMILPDYDAGQKLVNPPLVSLRLGSEIYIKGVVNGEVGIQYELPILENGKYALADISFAISEINAYSASIIHDIGAYRA